MWTRPTDIHRMCQFKLCFCENVLQKSDSCMFVLLFIYQHLLCATNRDGKQRGRRRLCICKSLFSVFWCCFFFAATHRLSRRDKFRSSFSWMNFFSRENFLLCKRTISEGRRGKTFSQRCACCTENAFETKQWENCWAGTVSVFMVFHVLCWWKISS